MRAIGTRQRAMLERMAAGGGVMVPTGKRELDAARRLHSRGLAAYHKFGSARAGWTPLLSITPTGREALR